MNVLIVSYYYAPANIIGAVRFTKLSKYLAEIGFNVTVASSVDNKWLFLNNDVKNDTTLENDIRDVNVIRIEHSSVFKGFSSFIRRFTKNRKQIRPVLRIKQQNSEDHNLQNNAGRVNFVVNKIKYNLSKLAMLTLSLLQDVDFAIALLLDKNIRKQLNDVDVVISTYGPYAGHIYCLFLRMFKKDIKWISDFRDPILQPTDPVSTSYINKFIQNRVVKSSDHVVCVSEGYGEAVVPTSHRHKLSVITNGYDLNDITSLDKEALEKCNSKFLFSYTGTLYSGRRDISIILKLLKQLVVEGSIKLSEIEFHYAGPEELYVSELFRSHDINEILVCHGQLPRLKALSLCAISDALIVSTWDEAEHRGVLPGKLYELMMFDAPIISIVTTSLKHTEISGIIEQHCLGFSYESSNSEHIEELKNFLKKIILDKVMYGIPYRRLIPSQFSYPGLADDYAAIINAISH